MDARKHRSDITQGEEASRTMLGEKQLAALYDWLGKVSEFPMAFILVIYRVAI